MTIYEFAEGLDGRDYGKEITPFEVQRAKELGFVVLFGYSDDNAEFRGAYDEEIGCYNGGRVYEDGDRYIDAVWGEGKYAWTYKTNIPHATFDIYEYGEKYCKGIVFEKDQKEILLRMNEGGVFEKYEEPFAVIECQTEEDFKQIKTALEKQKPQKPKITIKGTTDYNTNTLCPICGKMVRLCEKFCCNCGQALDWEKEKK